MRQALRILGVLLTSAVLLSGGSAPVPPVADQTPAAAVTASPAASTTTGLPVSDYYNTVNAPYIGPKAAFTGEIAEAAAGQVTVYEGAAGKPIALLPAKEMVPVVGRSDGWVQVMLMSRRGLPGQKSPLLASVNGATGWVKEGDLKVQKTGVRILVATAEQRLIVMATEGNAVIASYPATIGKQVPFGPTFVLGVGLADCGAPPTPLVAQSETTATFLGQPVSPTTIAGPSPDCHYTAKEAVDEIPHMIQISPEAAAEVAKLTVPGTFVDIVLNGDGSMTPSKTKWASYITGPSS